jgi:dolichol-phosphate mannosyltransferase
MTDALPLPAAATPLPTNVSGRAVVIAATYQERRNIGRLITGVLASDPRIDLLVVDDDSPDGTGRYVAGIAGHEPRLSLLSRKGRRGLGGAVLEGLAEARRRGYAVAVTMDADLSHDPADLPRLLAPLEDDGRDEDPRPAADVVIGSRKVSGGRVVGWPLSRHVLSRLVCWWTRWIMRVPVRDGSSGFRAIRVALLERMSLPRSRGYAFFEEMLWLAHRAGGRIVEVPILFTNRREGDSKAGGREMLRGAADLFRLGLLSWWS